MGGGFSAPASSAHSSDEPASSQTSSKKSLQPSFSSSVTENQTSSVKSLSESYKMSFYTKSPNKSLTKKDAVALILKNKLLNQQLPKYFIPVKASQDNYNNLEKVNDSNAFLCNDNNKLHTGILVELPNFNENSQINYFIIKNYDAIKNVGNGLIDKGTISNTDEVKFFRYSSTNTIQPSSDNSSQNIYEKVKDYIINGQNNLSDAERLNWSKRFLDQVNLEDLYKKYTYSGGDANNVQDFAKYITLNAPPSNNWKELFEKDYYDLYGKTLKITKIVNLGDDLYQIYINQNGSEVPFVVVSSRTGYFHG